VKLRQLGDSSIAATVCEMKREERTLGQSAGAADERGCSCKRIGLNVSRGRGRAAARNGEKLFERRD